MLFQALGRAGAGAVGRPGLPARGARGGAAGSATTLPRSTAGHPAWGRACRAKRAKISTAPQRYVLKVFWCLCWAINTASITLQLNYAGDKSLHLGT